MIETMADIQCASTDGMTGSMTTKFAMIGLRDAPIIQVGFMEGIRFSPRRWCFRVFEGSSPGGEHGKQHPIPSKSRHRK
jgi:hypothetical protein